VGIVVGTEVDIGAALELHSQKEEQVAVRSLSPKESEGEEGSVRVSEDTAHVSVVDRLHHSYMVVA